MKNVLLIACLVTAGSIYAQKNKNDIKDGAPKEVTVGATDHENKKGDIDRTGGGATLQNVNGTSSSSSSSSSGGAGNGKSSSDFQEGLQGVIRSDFGKNRSAEAKAAPANDEEAQAQIDDLRKNSGEGISSAENKIEIARMRLEELKSSGEISDEDYDAKMEQLESIEKRKDGLKSSMN